MSRLVMIPKIDPWFEKIPKIELHLHLEGAIPFEALWNLIEKYGGDPAVPTIDALQQRFIYRDFPHFIETWIWKNSFLREYEDFTFSAQAVARDLAAQNIRYAEVFFSAPDFFRHGLETQRLAEAIRAGFSKVKAIEIGLVADLVRDFGPERAARTLEEVNEVKGCGLVGIGIGGSEADFPPEPFAGVYEQAREYGFRTSAHAGEVAGPQSVWSAVRDLKVDRIGHGTRAEEDQGLLTYLAEHQIPIEMCPISNLKTGVVPAIREHPVRRYFERGLMVTVNSDDPKMFGNSLAQEYQTLVDELAFTKTEIRTLILQGIEASWLPKERKDKMAAIFKNDPRWRQAIP